MGHRNGSDEKAAHRIVGGAFNIIFKGMETVVAIEVVSCYHLNSLPPPANYSQSSGIFCVSFKSLFPSENNH